SKILSGRNGSAQNAHDAKDCLFCVLCVFSWHTCHMTRGSSRGHLSNALYHVIRLVRATFSLMRCLTTFVIRRKGMGSSSGNARFPFAPRYCASSSRSFSSPRTGG